MQLRRNLIDHEYILIVFFPVGLQRYDLYQCENNQSITTPGTLTTISSVKKHTTYLLFKLGDDKVTSLQKAMYKFLDPIKMLLIGVSVFKQNKIKWHLLSVNVSYFHDI